MIVKIVSNLINFVKSEPKKLKILQIMKFSTPFGEKISYNLTIVLDS